MFQVSPVGYFPSSSIGVAPMPVLSSLKGNIGQTVTLLLACLALALTQSIASAAGESQTTYATKATEVMAYIQHNLYNPDTGLYYQSITNHNPDFMWGNGITFSALVAADRFDPKTYLPITGRFFKAMDRYWDSNSPIPGYEPVPTDGNGNDKYYDDNEWMVLTFCEVYDQSQQQLAWQRAQDALKFALSGWDEQLDGGLWWHEGHKGGGKNTCSNAPAALGCLRVARHLPANEAASAVAMAKKIVAWTDSHFLADDGLYMDNQNVSTGKVAKFKLTYNTALMIRAKLELYRWTGKKEYLEQAKRSAQAADWFVDRQTGAYRDAVKWSHLMVESDLELYRFTHDKYLLARAKANADFFYRTWKQAPPAATIDNSSTARLLYLLADTEFEKGRQFWAQSDRIPSR